MGKSKKNRDHHRVRIIWLERPDKVILLATNLATEEAEALVAGLKARAREADLARESSHKRYLANKQAAKKWKEGGNRGALARRTRGASACPDRKLRRSESRGQMPCDGRSSSMKPQDPNGLA
jgi:hypothetical protein